MRGKRCARRGPGRSLDSALAGDEVVIVIEGSMVLVLDLPTGEERHALRAPQVVIVPAGVWHSADVEDRAVALFLTLGEGTQNRPR